jgi:sporulation protein YlmC with PRC-barrel domain
MNAQELIGKPVVSISDGARVGTVKDLLVDTAGLSIAGFLIGGAKGDGRLQFDQIKANGNDAITIENVSSVEWNIGRPANSERRMTDFLELAVINEAGSALGNIHDVLIDDSGRIESLAMREGGVFGIGSHRTSVPRTDVRAVGERMITVSGPMP